MIDSILLTAMADMGVKGISCIAGESDIRFQAVFMIGPSGAGKSWMRNKKYLKHMGFRLIDPDEVKKRHPDYDPNRPSIVHEWSKEVSDSEFKSIVTSGNGDPVVIDGTGRDVHGIYKKVGLAKDNGYRTFLVYVWVPLEVSLWRNRNRDRFVPEAHIMDAYGKISQSFGMLKNIVDKYSVIPNYETKDMEDAKRDLELYPAPQANRPPRPGDSDYGVMSLAASLVVMANQILEEGCEQ